MEQADGVRASAHAGDQRIRQAARLIQHLLPRLPADHCLEVAHQRRIGMRPGHGADDVEGGIDVGHPVAHGLVERVLEGPGAGLHADHLGPEQAHAIDIDGLAANVLGPHVDDALHAQPRRHRGRGHAVLAGAGLADHARLAHVAGQQGLADGVVDLVRAGVVQILALEPDLRAAEPPAPALGVIERRRTTHVVGQIAVQLGPEFGIVAQAFVGLAQFLDGLHQGLGDETSTVGPEVPVLVRQLAGGGRDGLTGCGHDSLLA